MNKNDNLVLKWNHFKEVWCFNFYKFLQEKKYTDVALSVEGKFLSGHKMILAASSKYFEQMFDVPSDKANDRQLIILSSELSYKDMESILEFIYKGEVTIHSKYRDRFLKAARLLQLKGVMGSVLRKDVADQDGIINVPPTPPKEIKLEPGYQVLLDLIHQENNGPANSTTSREIEEDLQRIEAKITDPKPAKIRKITNNLLLPVQVIKDDNKILNAPPTPPENKSHTSILPLGGFLTKNDEDEGHGSDDTYVNNDTSYQSSEKSDNRKLGTSLKRKRAQSKKSVRNTKKTSSKQLCDHCDKLIMKQNINTHQRSCNMNPRREKHECPVCNKQLSRADKLRYHINVIHKGLKAKVN